MVDGEVSCEEVGDGEVEGEELRWRKVVSGVDAVGQQEGYDLFGCGDAYGEVTYC